MPATVLGTGEGERLRFVGQPPHEPTGGDKSCTDHASRIRRHGRHKATTAAGGTG